MTGRSTKIRMRSNRARNHKQRRCVERIALAAGSLAGLGLVSGTVEAAPIAITGSPVSLSFAAPVNTEVTWDVDGANGAEFSLSRGNFGSYQLISLNSVVGKGGGFVGPPGASDNVAALARSFMVGPTLANGIVWGSSGVGRSAFTAYNGVPQFGFDFIGFVTGDNFIGFRFHNAASQLHYGFARINFDFPNGVLSIIDWTYETEPNTAVHAEDIQAAPVPTGNAHSPRAWRRRFDGTATPAEGLSLPSTFTSSPARLLLIGWDAADWKVIRPLVERGGCPTSQKLIDGGVSGNLASLQPMLSPMLWTSIATGKRPHKHGIHGFTEPRPERRRHPRRRQHQPHDQGAVEHPHAERPATQLRQLVRVAPGRADQRRVRVEPLRRRAVRRRACRGRCRPGTVHPPELCRRARGTARAPGGTRRVDAPAVRPAGGEDRPGPRQALLALAVILAEAANDPRRHHLVPASTGRGTSRPCLQRRSTSSATCSWSTTRRSSRTFPTRTSRSTRA